MNHSCVVALLLTASLLPGGCGGGRDTKDKGGAGTISTKPPAPGRKTPAPTEHPDNEVVLLSAVPEDFPMDIPLHPASNPTRLERGQTYNNFRITKLFLKSTAAADEVAAFYQQEFPKQGWKPGTFFRSGDTLNGFFTKGDRTASILGEPKDYWIKVSSPLR